MASIDRKRYEYWYSIGEAEIEKFWARFGGIPPLDGKRVMDFGCGAGRFCAWLARHGASRVLGIDINPETIRFATSKASSLPSSLKDRMSFSSSGLGSVPDGSFDIIVSKDVFEHVADVPGTLAGMKRVLAPGGRVYAAIGPFFRSPFGFHNRWKFVYPWLKVQVPWLHLLFPERVLVHRWNQNVGKSAIEMKELGINKIRFSELVDDIDRSGLQTIEKKVNDSNRFISRVASFLRRVRVFEDLCTFNLYTVLEKAIPSGATTTP